MVYTSPQPVQAELDFTGVSENPDSQNTTPAADGAVPKTPTAKQETTPKKPDQEQPDNGGYEGSQFLNKKTSDELKERFGIKNIDPHLEEMLKNSKPRSTKDGLAIDMENGNTLVANNKYVGLAKDQDMKPEDAKAIIGIAEARGWKSIDISYVAAPNEKDMLWIEAQRHGLKVGNYSPDENSPVARQWAKEKAGGPAVTEGADEDKIHRDTLKLLQDKAKAETDPAMKLGLEKMFKRIENMETPTSAATLASLTEALSDKHKGREGFNLAVDVLTKADPQLGIAKIEDPSISQAAPGRPKPSASRGLSG
jgi:hypothetical protein